MMYVCPLLSPTLGHHRFGLSLDRARFCFSVSSFFLPDVPPAALPAEDREVRRWRDVPSSSGEICGTVTDFGDNWD